MPFFFKLRHEKAQVHCTCAFFFKLRHEKARHEKAQVLFSFMSETTSADEAAGVASDASVEGAQETPMAMTDPPANVPQNGINGPDDMYLALKRMTQGVTRWHRGPRRV